MVAFFYFEHPLSAKSWYLDELWELSQHGDVEAVVVHMCCVALTAEDSAGTGLEKNPTKVLTSLPSIASAIDRQCEGGGDRCAPSCPELSAQRGNDAGGGRAHDVHRLLSAHARVGCTRMVIAPA